MKMLYRYAMEYYSAIKKNKIMPFAATWMDQEIIILSEVSQTEKESAYIVDGILNQMNFEKICLAVLTKTNIYIL